MYNAEVNPSLKKLVFFLYARKSSESEDRQVQSIEDQIAYLKSLAERLNIKIVQVYTEAKTAKKPHCRPVFAEMIKRIKHGEADGILCWQINRLFRNPFDQGQIGQLLQDGSLQCIHTHERAYFPEDNVLLFNIEGGMANQYIIDLRKNCMRGMKGKADRGWLPSRPPLGYLNEQLERTIIEDKERFLLVRKMWDLMLTGNYTASYIQEIANSQWGFRTPKHKRSGGNSLAKSTIYKLFTNIFYTGMFEWNGNQYQGKHKPMITLEEYDKVQLIPFYIEDGMTDEASNLIQSIGESQSDNENQNFVSLMTVLNELKIDSANVFQMSNDQEEAIREISASGTQIAGAAKNILSLVFNEYFDVRPIPIPENYNKKGQAQPQKTEQPKSILSASSNHLLDIYPNPASSFLNINFMFTKHYNSKSASIIDVSGKLIGTYSISTMSGSIGINTMKMENGVYFVKLTGDCNIISVKKFVIIN